MFVAVALFLVALAIPNFVQPRVAHGFKARNACIANLKQIQGAKDTWALEEKKGLMDTLRHSELYGLTNYLREAPFCPQGGIYTIGSVGEKPKCSLSARGHSL